MFIFLSGKFTENYKIEFINIVLFKVSSVNRLIKIDLPKIKYELILITATLFVLSLGDLTSVTIFNDSSFKTVPLYISQLYSSYRYDDAFFILSIFILLIFQIMYIPTKLIKKNVKS